MEKIIVPDPEETVCIPLTLGQISALTVAISDSSQKCLEVKESEVSYEELSKAMGTTIPEAKEAWLKNIKLANHLLNAYSEIIVELKEGKQHLENPNKPIKSHIILP